jgi:hypothetical protein
VVAFFLGAAQSLYIYVLIIKMKIQFSNKNLAGAFAWEKRTITPGKFSRELYFREDPEPYHSEEVKTSSEEEIFKACIRAGFERI